MSEQRFFHVGPDGRLRRLPALDDLLSALRDGGYAWLDFFNPSKDDLMALVEPFGLHPLSVEDCLDEDQVPKIEDFPTNTFVLLNGYHYRDGVLTLEEVDFILGKNFLVTVTGHQDGSFRFYEKLEQAVALDPASVQPGPDYLLHVTLDYVVDHKFAAIEARAGRHRHGRGGDPAGAVGLQPGDAHAPAAGSADVAQEPLPRAGNPGQGVPARLALRLRKKPSTISATSTTIWPSTTRSWRFHGSSSRASWRCTSR